MNEAFGRTQNSTEGQRKFNASPPDQVIEDETIVNCLLNLEMLTTFLLQMLSGEEKSKARIGTSTCRKQVKPLTS